MCAQNYTSLSTSFSQSLKAQFSSFQAHFNVNTPQIERTYLFQDVEQLVHDPLHFSATKRLF